MLDGASGTAVKQAYNSRQAVNIREMIDNSIYTFEGLASTNKSDTVTMEDGWNHLMMATTDTTAAQVSVLKRLRESNSEATSAVWASGQFYKGYAGDADYKYEGSSDSEVAQCAIDSLSVGTAPDLSIVELHGVADAGEEYGYYEDETGQYATSEVLSAISVVDGYVGTIVSALKRRPDYSSENWIVIVTSNNGGCGSETGNDTGSNVYSQKDKNTFSMIYSDRLSSQLLQAPQSDITYSWFCPAFSNKNYTDMVCVTNDSLFEMKYNADLDSIKAYTIQFCALSASTSAEKFYTLVSKATKGGPGEGEGWEIRYERGNYSIRLNNKKFTANTSSINDAKWHVFTVVLDYPNQRLRMYTDGVPQGKDGYFDLTQDPSCSKGAPLAIGKIKGSSANSKGLYYVSNLQVYDIALPEDFIQANYSQIRLDELASSYKYWDNLIGYWPADREEDYRKDIVPDYSKYGSVFNGPNAGKTDMVFSGNVTWDTGNSQENNIFYVSDSYYQSVINTVDIAYQTFQWLGLQVKSEWEWEGIARALPYMSLE